MNTSIYNRLRSLESRTNIRFGIITEVDLTGNADWNRKRFVPAARVLIQDKGETEVTCRVSARHGYGDEGIWWPPRVNEIVAVAFQGGLESGIIVGSLWSDEQAQTPTEATADNVVIKRAGHTIIIDGKAGDGGISIRTASGIEIDAQDKTDDQKLSITHPSGTNAEINNFGNVLLECVGDLEAGIDGDVELTIGGDLYATVGGDMDVDVAGRSLINSAGVNEIRSATEVLLKTASEATGMLTQATHPVCMLMGVPNGTSATVKGSS